MEIRDVRVPDACTNSTKLNTQMTRYHLALCNSILELCHPYDWLCIAKLCNAEFRSKTSCSSHRWYELENEYETTNLGEWMGNNAMWAVIDRVSLNQADNDLNPRFGMVCCLCDLINTKCMTCQTRLMAFSLALSLSPSSICVSYDNDISLFTDWAVHICDCTAQSSMHKYHHHPHPT